VGAAVAVGDEVGQRRGERRVRVVEVVAEDVEVLVVAVQGGELGGGDEADALGLRGFERLVDPGDRVVVGEREQLDAGVRGGADDLGGRERAVGVRRVRLEVEGGGGRR
jgi:hypothetical protein